MSLDMLSCDCMKWNINQFIKDLQDAESEALC